MTADGTRRTYEWADRRQFLRTGGSVAASAASVATAGCTDLISARTKRSEETPVRIGVSLPYTGFMAEEGPELFLGLEFWRRTVNADGGLLGRPVEFVVYDDGSTAEGAAAAYRRLLEEDDVDLVLGTAGTLGSSGAIEVLEAREMPCVFPMSSGPRAWNIDREWCVPLLPIAGTVARGIVAVLESLGMRSFAIVRSSSGYATDLTAGLKQHLRDAGIELLEEAVYPRNDAEKRRAALERAAGAGADVVGPGGSVAAVKPLIQDVARMDVEAEAFAWFDFDDTRLFPVARATEGMLGTGMWAAEADFRENDRFVDQFSEWAERRKPDWSRVRLLQHHSPAAYAGAVVLQRAVEAAGSIAPRAVRDELWALETATPFGRYEVDEDGYQVGKEMFVLQYQRRMREIVWPPRLGTAGAERSTLEQTEGG